MKDYTTATIEDLPDPIIEYILSYLSPYRDFKQCMLVNKTWYRYVQDVIRKTHRDFHNAVCSMSVQWQHVLVEPGPTISKRFSHSACCAGNSMYVFGGCTSANTTFNDLWRLDLGTRCWIRPLATGTYPPPKACGTLVSHNDNLILFGGWTYTSPYTLNQVWRIFDQIHVYNTITNRWTQMTSVTSCPSMAGHSATIHGDLMVVFGGIHENTCEGPFKSSNSIWTLDLKTYKWQQQETSETQPSPRCGHSQIAVDRYHLIIIGGCGGPNKLHNDVWLLKMTDSTNDVWQWQQLEINSKEFGAPFIAFHPACKVGNQVVALCRSKRSRTSPSSSFPVLLRPSSRIWIPPRMEDDRTRTVKRAASESDPCVNGKKGVLKRPNQRQQARPPAVSSSDEEEGAALHNVGCREPSLLLLNSPSTSAAGDRVPEPVAGSSKEGARQPPRGIPVRRNRQRQLEGLDRMEQRLLTLRANVQRLQHNHPPAEVDEQLKESSRTPLGMYVMDVSNAISEGVVTWRSVRPPPTSAPDDLILYSLVLGKGELILFGGIQKDLKSRPCDGEPLADIVSNAVHFMTAERFVI